MTEQDAPTPARRDAQTARPLRLLFVTPDLENNSTGRAYALWSLSQHLGWPSRVVAPRGGRVWRPLEGTEFAGACSRLSDDGADERSRLESLASDADLIVAVKAVPDSFGLAMRVSRLAGTPVLLDVDDPDLEVALSLDDAPRRIAKRLLLPQRQRRYRALRAAALAHDHVTVSNPALQAIYGGTILPHPRVDPGIGRPHATTAPTVVFVGTAVAHKGLADLRWAIARLQRARFSLVVTDDPPRDAQPWERWVGRTSLAEGLQLVRDGDIVVTPSVRSTMSRGQLPVKLIDAMMAGRGIVVSDLPPLTWAVDGAAIRFAPGSRAGLRRALAELADPAVRTALGERARETALRRYSIPVLAERFRAACLAAVSTPSPDGTEQPKG